jgi:hypothetical protein
MITAPRFATPDPWMARLVLARAEGWGTTHSYAHYILAQTGELGPLRLEDHMRLRWACWMLAGDLPARVMSGNVICLVPMLARLPDDLWRPRGVVLYADGSRILTSRHGIPLWLIAVDGTVVRCLPDAAMVAGAVDAVTLSGGEAAALLAAYGIVGLPILVDALPRLLATDRPLRAIAAEMAAERRPSRNAPLPRAY